MTRGTKHKLGPEIYKSMSQLNVWGLSLGCAVGWGAFMMPGTTFLPLAGPVGTVLGVILGGMIMMIIGINYHYLINHYPDSGGSFSYARENLGHDHGFLCAWFLALIYISIAWANATALPLIFSHLVGDFFKVGFHYQIAGYDVYMGEAMLSTFALILIGALNYVGKRLPGIVQTIFAIAMFVGISIIFIAAVVTIFTTGITIKPSYAPNHHSIIGITSIIALAPWAFVGFETVSHATEDFNFHPQKSLKIILLAVLAGMFCYSALVVTAVSVLPEGYTDWSSYISDLDNLQGLKSVPVFYAVDHILGKPGVAILGVAILGAVLSGILGNSFALSRLMFSMNCHKMLPGWFGTSKGKHMPINIIPFFVIISLPIPFLGRSVIGWIVDISTVGAAIAYMYTSLVAYRIAKDEKNTWIKITGFIGMACSASFFMFFLLPIFSSVSKLATESYLILVIWSVIGFVFFRYIYHKDEEWKFGNSTVVWTILLFLIFFTTTLWTRQASQQTTSDAINSLIDYHGDELQRRGIEIDEEHEAIFDDFIETQIDSVNSSFMVISSIQICLLLLAIIILFNLYNAIIQRQRKAAEDLIKTKNDFLSNMSHEIRTPLNTILGMDEMLLRETNEENVIKYATNIQTAGNILVSMVNDILDYSKIDSGKIELAEAEYDLREMLAELANNIGTRAKEKGLIFDIKVDKNIPSRLCGDKIRLRQIFHNLLSNAVKYTESGKVSLSISFSRQDEDHILLQSSIIDTGVGISADDQKHLFNSFERINDRRSITVEGTGLGLNIVKRLLEIMDGKLEIKSVVDLGSNFTFTVSQKVLDWTALGEYSFHEDLVPKKKGKYLSRFTAPDAHILLVDDTEMNLFVCANLLKDTKIKIDTAKDGAEGLEMTRNTEYDLLFIDHRMPVMDGVQMLLALRKETDNPNSKKPCISLTANAGDDARDEYLKLGFDDYMAKPVSGSSLEKMLMGYLPKNKIKRNA